jgi:hypothetical protein
MTTNNWWDDQDAAFVADSIASGTGYQGTDEYEPLGCDRTDLPDNPQRASLVDPQTKAAVPLDGIRLHVEAWTAEHKIVSVDSPRPTTLVLQLIAYPAWRATLNGAAVAIQPLPDTAIVSLPLAAGSSRVELRFTRTRDRTLGGLISLAAGICLLPLARFRTRRL